MRPWFGSVVIAILLAGDAAASATRVREITVLGRSTDSRVDAVYSAVAFWNRAMTKAGADERLAVTRLRPNPLPVDYFESLEGSVRGRSAPAQAVAIEGDIVIALVDAEFISYAVRMPDRRRFVALRQLDSGALARPGVAVNLAAHELGHSLGLHHNADPDSLMCGAPASCRPSRFATASGRIFPLTAADRERLRLRAAWIAQRRADRR